MAERKTTQYALIICQGGLDSPVNKVHLAIGRIILCISETTLVEGTLALLAMFYVFMYEYPPGLVHFLHLQKCILQVQDGRKLPSSIIHFVNSLYDIKVGTYEGTSPCDCVVSESP